MNMRVLLLVYLYATTFAQAQDSPGKANSHSLSLLDYYWQGGSLMHVLLLCSIGTLAVATYCFLHINSKKLMPPKLVESMTRHMERRDVTHAYELLQSNPCCFSEVLSAALPRVNFERDRANKDSMIEAAGETMDMQEGRYMTWVNYLNVFATLAPMVGLLGTVMGMIESFEQLAQKRSQPEDLAGGIKVAMITTAGGLLVGIPAMFLYFFFREKLVGLMAGVQRNVSFLIDLLTGEVKLAGSASSSTES